MHDPALNAIADKSNGNPPPTISSCLSVLTASSAALNHVKHTHFTDGERDRACKTQLSYKDHLMHSHHPVICSRSVLHLSCLFALQPVVFWVSPIPLPLSSVLMNVVAFSFLQRKATTFECLWRYFKSNSYVTLYKCSCRSWTAMFEHQTWPTCI